MALLDTLRARTARKGGAAQVDCGELGVLTVEALPAGECVRLAKDPRALFYAACRELQKSGETLRKEGKVFRPDEILTYVTDREAEQAARTILDISGVSAADSADLSEIRLQSVQTSGMDFSEIRHQTVQSSEAGLAGYGQVSREFSPSEEIFGSFSRADKKSQILGDLSARTAQIMGAEKNSALSGGSADGMGRLPLHEMESDLHEGKSDSIGGILHETTSEFVEMRRLLLHEMESEFQKWLHESKSELAQTTAQHLAQELRRAAAVQ